MRQLAHSYSIIGGEATMDRLIALASQTHLGQLTLQQFRARTIQCVGTMSNDALLQLMYDLNNLDIDDDLDATDVVELQRR